MKNEIAIKIKSINLEECWLPVFFSFEFPPSPSSPSVCKISWHYDFSQQYESILFSLHLKFLIQGSTRWHITPSTIPNMLLWLVTDSGIKIIDQ